jgi:hypothetical protein
MPSESLHLSQTRHNLAFLQSFYAPSTPYGDWAVTVAFYAAVHALEAVLARHGLHCQSHRERRRYVRLMFPQIWALYYRLDVFSRRARYDGFHPPPTLLSQLIDRDLPAILNQLGITP